MPELDPPRMRMHEIYLQAEQNRLRCKKIATLEEQKIVEIASKVIDEAMKRQSLCATKKEQLDHISNEVVLVLEKHVCDAFQRMIGPLENKLETMQARLSVFETWTQQQIQHSTIQMERDREQLSSLVASSDEHSSKIMQLQHMELGRQKDSFALSSLLVWKEEFQDLHSTVQRKLQSLQKVVNELIDTGSEHEKLVEDVKALKSCITGLQHSAQSAESFVSHVESRLAALSEEMEEQALQEKKYGELLASISDVLIESS